MDYYNIDAEKARQTHDFSDAPAAEVGKSEVARLARPDDVAQCNNRLFQRRIIEVAVDHERHELRDPATAYRAYVPQGSIARGRTIAQIGRGGTAVACVACHGADLRGPLRSGATDEELLARIRGVWLERDDRYSEQRKALGRQRSQKKIEMYYIGG